ncbi:hypothetical protein K450DRAFT_280540 [Umbelopsis ramanniana AG]|uniref:Uncharacterized protein n=1 Tax=Umbelopsis ramanniana AG TaxID=1314678 RepID=A0AAD5EBC9_UMBRA|nr:uncharacterized protein K450DRAFT_280540 [Umbelopsis ramanniana AG]KAI8579836.1 hypothetical protein K450DRAFT_280540 [Umbelopsis ramanniana AG]
MKLDILVLALLASEASAVCIFGFGCDQSSSSAVNGYQLAVDTGSASPSQTQGSGSNNNNSNTSNSGSSTTSFITTATSTSTSVTADGGTNGISAFPATTWNGPHLRSTATNTYNSNPTNANNGGNSGYGNSGYGSNNNNSNSGTKVNAGAVAGGVIGALIVIGAAAGLIFFLYRRSRQRRENANYGTKLSENDFTAGAAAGPTLPSAAYNEPSRYDNGRRFVQQKNPHPPPIGFNNITPTQKSPPYQAEYGQMIEKPSEDTPGGAWKPDVAESKPNV